MTKSVRKSFSFWRILLPVIIGILVSVYLIANNLNKESVIQTKPGEGTLIWTDNNKNNKIDYHDISDFDPANENGDYTIVSSKELFSSIQWNTNTFLFYILAFVFMFGRDLGYVIRLQILSDKQLSIQQSIRSILLWEFASAISPGVVGGTSVAMFILKKEGLNLGRSTSIVFVTALLDNLFYVIVVPIILLAFSADLLFPSELIEKYNAFEIFIFGYIVILLFSVLLFVAVFIKPQIIQKLFKFAFKLPLIRRWKSNLEEINKDVVTASKVFKGKGFGYWLKAFTATILSWSSRYLVVNCLLMAFISLNLNENIIAFGRQLMMWVILIIPSVPGASGIAEISFSGFFEDFINSALFATLIAVLWRLVSYYPYILIGMILLPKWLTKRKN